MARKKRIQLPNITYHVCSRCIEARDLMSLNEMKNIFIDVVNAAMDKYEFNFNTYAILGNHFHLVIKTVNDDHTISHIMQYIKARFAERYNKKLGRIGPVWNERFIDTIIEFTENPMDYFNWLVWYIGYNPVRKRLVTDPRKYIFGGINAYLDESYQSPIKITLHDYFLCLGDTFMERVNQFLVYEEAYRKQLSIMFF